MTIDRKVLLGLIHSLMVEADTYGSGDTSVQESGEHSG